MEKNKFNREQYLEQMRRYNLYIISLGIIGVICNTAVAFLLYISTKNLYAVTILLIPVVIQLSVVVFYILFRKKYLQAKY